VFDDHIGARGGTDMTRRPRKLNGWQGSLAAAAMFGLAALILLGATGCDLYGYGNNYGLMPGYGYVDSGFYPDAATIQSVNDNRQAAFETANDAWDAYILERRK
jgi:hypothetical protein